MRLAHCTSFDKDIAPEWDARELDLRDEGVGVVNEIKSKRATAATPEALWYENKKPLPPRRRLDLGLMHDDGKRDWFGVFFLFSSL